jgi:hypothetical protein
VIGTKRTKSYEQDLSYQPADRLVIPVSIRETAMSETPNFLGAERRPTQSILDPRMN